MVCRVRTPRVAGAAVAAVLLSGCASGQEQAIERAATRFGEALRTGDVAQACRLLAPLTREELESAEGRPCPQALAAQELPAATQVGSLQRFGRQASVVVSAPGEGDTWFLSRFDGTWLVVAAGCTARGGGLPYACDVEGP